MTLRPARVAAAPPASTKTRNAADLDRPAGRAALMPTAGAPALAAARPVAETDAPQTQAAP